LVKFSSLPLVSEDHSHIVDDWQVESLREREREKEANNSGLRREKKNIKMGLFWYGDAIKGATVQKLLFVEPLLSLMRDCLEGL
jgi:hypothetical protein